MGCKTLVLPGRPKALCTDYSRRDSLHTHLANTSDGPAIELVIAAGLVCHLLHAAIWILSVSCHLSKPSEGRLTSSTTTYPQTRVSISYEQLPQAHSQPVRHDVSDDLPAMSLQLKPSLGSALPALLPRHRPLNLSLLRQWRHANIRHDFILVPKLGGSAKSLLSEMLLRAVVR